MIQQITLNTPSPVNFYNDGSLEEETIYNAPVKADTIAREMAQIANLLAFITKHPDRDICAAISYIMDKVPEVRWNNDKTERQIRVSYLFIKEAFPQIREKNDKRIQNKLK